MPVCIHFGVGFLVGSCVQREWVVGGCGLYGYFSEQGLPVVVVVIVVVVFFFLLLLVLLLLLGHGALEKGFPSKH